MLQFFMLNFKSKRSKVCMYTYNKAVLNLIKKTFSLASSAYMRYNSHIHIHSVFPCKHIYLYPTTTYTHMLSISVERKSNKSMT